MRVNGAWYDEKLFATFQNDQQKFDELATKLKEEQNVFRTFVYDLLRYYALKIRKFGVLYYVSQIFIALASLAVTILVNYPEVPKLIISIITFLIASTIFIMNLFNFGGKYGLFKATYYDLALENLHYTSMIETYEGLFPGAALDQCKSRVYEIMGKEVKQNLTLEKMQLEQNKIDLAQIYKKN